MTHAICDIWDISSHTVDIFKKQENNRKQLKSLRFRYNPLIFKGQYSVQALLAVKAAKLIKSIPVNKFRLIIDYLDLHFFKKVELLKGCMSQRSNDSLS